MLLAETSATLPLWPVQATEFAVWYDRLFIYISVVNLVAGIGVFTALTYFCFRFAKKPGGKSMRILGSHKLELIWTAVPLAFFLSFFAASVPLFNFSTRIPEGAPEIYVVGKQWMWKIQHPDGVREINELHLKVDESVKITGTSEDVIHDFGIPAFRNKFDVLPGRYGSTWYKPNKIGSWHIFCDQYCGQGHSQMVGTVHVLSGPDYQAWKEGLKTDKTGSPGDRPTDGTSAWLGQSLFMKMQCINCHNNTYDSDGSNMNSSNRAPNLEGLYMSQVPVEGQSKTVLADDSYLRESIRNPMAKVHQGWKPIMPVYDRSRLSEEEILQLVAYIKYLKKGKLPRNTQAFPAPIGAPVQESAGAAAPVVAPPVAPKSTTAPAPTTPVPAAPMNPAPTTPKGGK